MSYRIGIDLGTTFSGAAYIDEHGKPVMIKNEDGSTTIPSVIYFGEGTPIVGEEAKERQAFGDMEVASFFKRSMGDEGFTEFFNGKTYSASELSAIVLRNIKENAERVLGEKIEEAVITVPAYFENKQREETIEAGRLAGLKVKTIINEPTAAALAYGIDQTKDQNLIVYDLGGGTFDVTIVEVSAEKIKVLATGGDYGLGGKDWDDRIIAHVAECFEEEHGVDPLDDLDTMNDLLVKGEQTKKQLTAREKATISVVSHGVKETYEITRDLFEDLTSDLLERTWSLTERTLEEANLTWRHISDVLLVGGSTRMPMVHKYIERTLGKPPLKGVHPDEAVAIGAAIRANLEDDRKKRRFTLGSAKEVVDVMSHSLGMVAMNQTKTKYINSIILSKNEPIPISRKKNYQVETRPGRGNRLEVYVTQGESRKPYECSIIGRYSVTEIEHGKDGRAEIEVSYAYDKNGVINVSARDRRTGVALPVIRETITDDLSWLREAPKEEEFEEVNPNLSVVIALDLSGSMGGEPLEKAQEAAIEFINKMDLSHTSISLVGFGDYTRVIEPLTNDYDRLMDSVERLSDIYNQGILGYGTSAVPFVEVKDILDDAQDLKFSIVLTDGLWFKQNEAIQAAKACHDEEIEVIAIGFGDADESFLQAIATADENALFTDLTQLVSSFSRIAQELRATNTSSIQRKGRRRIFR